MKLRDLKKKRFALCLDAGEYEGVSLFSLKIYQYVPEPASEMRGFLKVTDEEGEPYYYDATAFINLKSAARGLLIPLRR